MEHQKARLFFTTKTKLYIAGLVATLLGIYSAYLILYKELIGTPFKVLSSLELTRGYHSALALVASLLAWRLISNLPIMALSSKKMAEENTK